MSIEAAPLHAWAGAVAEQIVLPTSPTATVMGAAMARRNCQSILHSS